MKNDPMENRYRDRINSIFREVFKKEPVRIVLFGSRARNDAAAQSDFDFAVDTGKRVERKVLSILREKFEESTLPFQVDIVDFSCVSKAMHDQIIQSGKEWKFLN